MIIIVNYLPIFKGGGLQNAVNFWKSAIKYDKNNKWICLTREGSEVSKLDSDIRHTIIEVKTRTNYLYRLFHDNYIINKYAKKFKAEVIFTLAGPGPIHKKYHKVNGWHEPAYVYPESVYWERIDVKTRILQKLKYKYASWVLKRADKIIVQTQTMKNRMIKFRNISEEKLCIVPNGITSFKEEEYLSEEKCIIFNELGNKIKLLVLSEPWPHKNFEYLINVARLLSKKYVFILSFDDKTSAYASKFVKKVKSLELSSMFAFIGRVRHNEIKKIYENVDAIFLPTLLESFSANYIEAVYYKKPLFTSDIDFAREVCGQYAMYFNPLIPETGYNQLIYFFEQGGYKYFAKQLDKFVVNYPSWEERFNLYFNIIKKLGC